MGRIILVILLLLPITGLSRAEPLPYAKLFTFKQGELTQDEYWSGKILLLGDVIVPKGRELVIENESWIVFNGTDLDNHGRYPDKPELIVHGRMITPEGNEQIKLLSLGDKTVQDYIQAKSELGSVTIKPQDEPLADLEQDLHKSKRYYAWLWVAIYSIWLVL